jgi:hypothetical protein
VVEYLSTSLSVSQSVNHLGKERLQMCANDQLNAF